MPLLPAKLTILDVDDVERFASQIVRFSGLDLSHHEREDLTAYLIETAWELSLRYDPAGVSSFRIWARRTLRLRCVDWVRSHRGRTKWSFAAGSYERPRTRLVSLDNGVGSADDRLGEALAACDGDPASGRDSDLRGLFAGRDRQRARDLAEMGLELPG